MDTVENPPGFVVRTEAQKAAFDTGFRLENGVEEGWLRYGSTTARGEIWIAGASKNGPWFLSLSQKDIADEIGLDDYAARFNGPGAATFSFPALPDLYAALDRAYKLGFSLPDAPLQRFRAEVQNMPRTTEAERLVIQRVGQDLFRSALLDYWNHRCPLTGITDAALLRASHIVPWTECDNDAHRLDVHNGLLLSALWDAAFDKGLVSFADNGSVIVSDRLSAEARMSLNIAATRSLLGLTDAHRANLARHRIRHGF